MTYVHICTTSLTLDVTIWPFLWCSEVISSTIKKLPLREKFSIIIGNCSLLIWAPKLVFNTTVISPFGTSKTSQPVFEHNNIEHKIIGQLLAKFRNLFKNMIFCLHFCTKYSIVNDFRSRITNLHSFWKKNTDHMIFLFIR